jgi:alpha-galactosidase
MPIKFDEKQKSFTLLSKDSSYIIKILKNKYLRHNYWGKRISNSDFSDALLVSPFGANPDPNDKIYTLDSLPQNILHMKDQILDILHIKRTRG